MSVCERNIYKRSVGGKKPTRFYSKKQENKVAKEVNGKRTANSGATPFSKGDVRSDNILIECKTCVEPKKSFSIKKEWIEKNREEAFAMRKLYSALAIDFGDGEQHYLISSRLFKRLIDFLKEEENG